MSSRWGSIWAKLNASSWFETESIRIREPKCRLAAANDGCPLSKRSRIVHPFRSPTAVFYDVNVCETNANKRSDSNTSDSNTLGCVHGMRVSVHSFCNLSIVVMQLSIIHHPHPTLRVKSRPLVRVDAELKQMAEQMLELMYEAKGVGLAANQVNLPLRMFVVNPTGEKGDGEELILINPELQLPKGSETEQEGCLSLPGVYGQVKRPKAVRLSAYDINGNSIERTVDGFLARVLQHENDHIDGLMFFDRISGEARRELEGPLEELESDFRSKQRAGSIAADDTLIQELDQWYERYT